MKPDYYEDFTCIADRSVLHAAGMGRSGWMRTLL